MSTHPLLPLLLLLLVLALLFGLGYLIYGIASSVADQTARTMERKNVRVSKDGLVVGVRERKEEQYVGVTQSFLVKAWNFSTWPAYKSRLWNKDHETHPQPRIPYSRSTPSAGPKPKA